MSIAYRYLTLAAGLVSLNAFASCEHPSMIHSMPDGSTATMDDMIAAQTAVKTYMADMETYLACLNEDIEASGEDAAAEFKTLMVTRYNTAVTELETVAAAFNQQLQAYRAANPSDE
jgi:hypothetical protein